MRIWILHWVAKLLGVQIKIDGIPYGGAYKGPHRIYGNIPEEGQ